ncbi:MAG: hypothetical protein JNM72_14225 [Deltaproteobacteria bacterium]|nr:hypothetical protein [Deltaproteobacteria bacterium]
MPRTTPTPSTRARSRRSPAHPQQPALALLLSVGCGGAPPPAVELPWAAVAEAVPDSAFDVPAGSSLAEQLACTTHDPTGRSLATRRAVVRIDPEWVWVDGQAVEATAALSGAQAQWGDDSTPVLDALWALAMDHRNTAERFPCAAPFTGALLIEAPADLPVGALWVLFLSAGRAGYGDLWLRVEAKLGATAPARVTPQDKPPWLLDDLPACVRGLGLSWSQTGELFVVRWGQPNLTPDEADRYLDASSLTQHHPQSTAPPLNTAQLRARLPALPTWAEVQVGLRPTSGAPLADLVAAMVVVREVYGARALIGAGEVGLRPPHRPADTEGPQITALRYLLTPFCVQPWMTHVHTCAGLDGQEHPREAIELGAALDWGPGAPIETADGSIP